MSLPHLVPPRARIAPTDDGRGEVVHSVEPPHVPANPEAAYIRGRAEFASVFGDLAKGKRNWQLAAFGALGSAGGGGAPPGGGPAPPPREPRHTSSKWTSSDACRPLDQPSGSVPSTSG